MPHDQNLKLTEELTEAERIVREIKDDSDTVCSDNPLEILQARMYMAQGALISCPKVLTDAIEKYCQECIRDYYAELRRQQVTASE